MDCKLEMDPTTVASAPTISCCSRPQDAPTALSGCSIGNKQRLIKQDYKWTMMMVAIVAMLVAVVVCLVMLIQAKNATDEIRAESINLQRKLQELESQAYDDSESASATRPGRKRRDTGFANVEALAAKVLELEDRLNTSQQITRLRIKNSCTVFHNGKCFVSIAKEMKMKEAKKICRGLGGNMANIYSKTHYLQIMQYIPSSATDIEIREVLTGMTYDIGAGKPKLRDGTVAPFESWLSGWPDSRPKFTQIALRVSEDETETHVGMWNNNPKSYVYDSVLCEI